MEVCEDHRLLALRTDLLLPATDQAALIQAVVVLVVVVIEQIRGHMKALELLILGEDRARAWVMLVLPTIGTHALPETPDRKTLPSDHPWSAQAMVRAAIRGLRGCVDRH